jgi:hypothetical protein
VGFHYDTFWAVAGGAAPVIALAAVVSLAELRDLRTSTLGETDQKILRLPWDKANSYWGKAKRIGVAIYILVVFQAINIAVQCYVLWFSLMSLANSTNEQKPTLVAALETCGVAALAITGIGPGQVKFKRERLAANLSLESHAGNPNAPKT